MSDMHQGDYNGWTNWDTWNANLWLTNDERICTDATLAASPERLAYVAAEWLQSDSDSWIDGIDPDKVNWREIYDRLHEGEED